MAPDSSELTCPKCESALQRGDDACAACGTPLALATGARGSECRGAPIIDPLLEAFSVDPEVRCCPDCLAEFEGASTSCRRCGGLPLVRMRRSRLQEELVARPLATLAAHVSAGPPAVPPDLLRVKVLSGLAEVEAFRAELRFAGIGHWMGSDSLDTFDDEGRIGIYVRPEDEAGARYLALGFRPPDPLDRPPPQQSPGGDRLQEARGWLALGKYREVLRLCASRGPEVAALLLAGEACLLSGGVLEARRRALEAAATAPPGGRGRARLLILAGMAHALGFDGGAFAEGSDAPAARGHLEEGVALLPRYLAGGKSLAEVFAWQRDLESLGIVLADLERANPNLLAANGFFRDLRGRVTPPPTR